MGIWLFRLWIQCQNVSKSLWLLWNWNMQTYLLLCILYKKHVSTLLNYMCLCVCVCVCVCVCAHACMCWWCYAFHSTSPSHVCPIYLLHCLRQWWWGLSWNYLLCLLHTVAVLLGLHLVWLRTWDLSSWMGLWYEAENIPYRFCATLTENLFTYIYVRIFE